MVISRMWYVCNDGRGDDAQCELDIMFNLDIAHFSKC